ncbi:MAG TPA: type II toxin-antitoxin system RelE/ParE family toxin [Gemmatimonadales bacterium]|nr:type II toxin-antitoxin system RelE/ParE family toxin [Gemmatimonadales bacterium]
MPPRLSLNPEAQADLVEAFGWYEGQRPGLGGEFLAEVALILVRIEDGPLQFPVVQGETRRAIVHRFPYAVFFIVDPDVTAVTAVMHGRRDPSRWQTRR